MKTRIARLRGRLTYANVTASLALFIALGGTSYAAITLPRNSVGSKQIRAGAVRSADIRNRSVQVNDMSRRARRSLRGKRRPRASGVTDHAVINSSGGQVSGTASRVRGARRAQTCIGSSSAATSPLRVLGDPGSGAWRQRDRAIAWPDHGRERRRRGGARQDVRRRR